MRCRPQKYFEFAEAALERTVKRCLVFARLHVLVILNHANTVSLLDWAVARFDKSGFWSNILQKPAVLQPLKVFLMEGQRTQHAISCWTFCHRTELQHMWGGGSDYHCGGPLPKIKPIKHISPTRHDYMTCIKWGFAQAWQQLASMLPRLGPSPWTAPSAG